MAGTIDTADFSSAWGFCRSFDTTGDITGPIIQQDNTTTSVISVHKIQVQCGSSDFIDLAEGTGGDVLFSVCLVSNSLAWNMDCWKNPIKLKAHEGTSLSGGFGDGHVQGMIWYTKQTDLTA